MNKPPKTLAPLASLASLASTVLAGGALLAGCGTQTMQVSKNHIMAPPPVPEPIPQTVARSASLSPPTAAPKAETFSVTVHAVPVQSLLFALARDAKRNIDIHPGIEGVVTLNALNQTLPQLLNRIAKQVDMRYELDGNNIVVMRDTPFLRNYRVDYVNIARNTSGNVSIATEISTTGGNGVNGGAGGNGSNNSTTQVTNVSNNSFWATLVQNIKDTLYETDKLMPNADAAPAELATANPDGTGNPNPNPNPNQNANAGANGVAARQAAAARRGPAYREAASVIANPETGVIAVRATARQHEKIQAFLDLVMASAKRQVLIEATVVEVQLKDEYQQGVNWANVQSGVHSLVNLSQGAGGSSSLPSGIVPGTSPSIFTLKYLNSSTWLGNISATIQLLESFGKVKVLSSPKISVLNNQTALLKVVDNNIYFTVTATTTPPTIGTAAISTYSSEVHTVAVGFTMNVTPQIADSDEVTISVRPTISRIIGYVQDPNPALAMAVTPVVSNVPVIQTREMESVLKVGSGQVAVMGGLMQDTIDNAKDMVPVLGRLPVIGNAFGYRNEKAGKTELVIFMRPVVVKDASLNGDYKDYKRLLPDGKPLDDGDKREPFSALSSGKDAASKTDRT